MTVAREVANTACHKLVADMLYEARIQANCDYKRRIEKVKTNKGAVRNLRLTREQYMMVIPWWLAGNEQCWDMIIDRWYAEGWVEMHESCRQRRLMMPGAPHHQGNRHLRQYAARWVREFIFSF